MKLTALLGVAIAAQTPIAFIGKPEETGLTTTDGEPYWVWKLKQEITVRCSVDPAIEPLVTDELYLRKSLIDSDLWQPAVEGKPEEGVTIPDYKADFSKGHEVAIFQETTIAKWARDNRGERRERARKSINEKIRERQAARGK